MHKKLWYASSCDRKTADDVLFHINKVRNVLFSKALFVKYYLSWVWPRAPSLSGRGIYGEKELRSRRPAALHISGVLQGQSVQHPNPLCANYSAVRAGKTEERGGGTVEGFSLLVLIQVSV